MAWHTLTIDDVFLEITPQEQATLKGIQGATEALPGILTRVISAARGAVRAGGYALGDEGTTPDQLDLEIIAVARWRWLIAFPQLQRLQTRERKEAHDDAMERLDRVARQELRIESPIEGINPLSGNWNSENKLLMRTHPVPPPLTQWPDQDPNQRPYANPEGPGDE